MCHIYKKNIDLAINSNFQSVGASDADDNSHGPHVKSLLRSRFRPGHAAQTTDRHRNDQPNSNPIDALSPSVIKASTLGAYRTDRRSRYPRQILS